MAVTLGEPGVDARRGSGDPPPFDLVFIIEGVRSGDHTEIKAGWFQQ